MRVFICVHECCLATENGYDVISGYDIVGVFNRNLDAYTCINTLADDVMNKKGHEGLSYNVEYEDENDAIIIQYSDLCTELFYVLEKEVL